MSALLARFARQPALLADRAARSCCSSINLIAFPGFFTVTIKDGHLFGSLIDILRNGAPTLIIADRHDARHRHPRHRPLGRRRLRDLGRRRLRDHPGLARPRQPRRRRGRRRRAPCCICLVLGVWNGFLVAVLGIQPIIATLILMTAGRGIAMLITEGQIITVNSAPFKTLGSGFLARHPGRGHHRGRRSSPSRRSITRRSALGMLIESVGINPEASRQAGVRARGLLFAVYTFCAFSRGHRGPHPHVEPDGGGCEQHRPVHRARRDPRRRHRRHLARRRALLAHRHPRRRPRHPDARDHRLHGRHPADRDDGLQGRRRHRGLPAAVARPPTPRFAASGDDSPSAPERGSRHHDRSSTAPSPDASTRPAGPAGARAVGDASRDPHLLRSPKYGPVLVTAVLLIVVFIVGGMPLPRLPLGAGVRQPVRRQRLPASCSPSA